MADQYPGTLLAMNARPEGVNLDDQEKAIRERAQMEALASGASPAQALVYGDQAVKSAYSQAAASPIANNQFGYASPTRRPGEVPQQTPVPTVGQTANPSLLAFDAASSNQQTRASFPPGLGGGTDAAAKGFQRDLRRGLRESDGIRGDVNAQLQGIKQSYDDAGQLAREVGKARADAQFGEAEGQRMAQEEFLQRQQDTADRRKQYEKEWGDDYAAKKDAYSKLAVDPEKFWNSKGTGSKVASFIGLVLGGIGSGLTGGPNAALATLDKLIENDINAQKDNIYKQGKELDSMRDDRNDKLQSFGREDNDTLAKREASYEAARIELNKALSGVTNKEALAKGAELDAQLQEKIFGIRQDAAQRSASYAIDKTNTEANLYNQGAARRMQQGQLEIQGMAAAAKQQQAYATPVGTELYDPKLPPPGDTEKKEARALLDVTTPVMGQLKLLREAIAKGNASPSARDNIRQIAGSLTPLISQAYKLGAISEGDKAIIESVTGADFEDLWRFGQSVSDQIGNIENSVRAQTNAQLKSRNLQIQAGENYAKGGRVEPAK